MDKSNYFSSRVKQKDSNTLRQIALTEDEYSKSMVLASLWELAQREDLNEALKNKLVELELAEDKDSAKNEKSKVKQPFFLNSLPFTIKIAAALTISVFLFELIGFVFLGQSTSVNFSGLKIPGSFISLASGIYLLTGRRLAKFIFLVVFTCSTLFYFAAGISLNPIHISQQIVIIGAFVFVLLPKSTDWYRTY